MAGTVGSSYKDVVARTLLCGARLDRRHLLERVAVPAGPGRRGRAAGDRGVDPRGERGLPAVLAESQERARLPVAVRHQRRPPARLPQPDPPGGKARRGRAENDTSVHGASVVGRAGVESKYDRYLRGSPGFQRVAVDSMGRVLGDSGEVQGRAGDTLVTSIDARVQAVVEQQLESAIKLARKTMDTVTGRQYVADSGAAVVMDATNGRIVAMASQPTYDPSVWVGGISRRTSAGSTPRRPARRCCSGHPRASSRRRSTGSRS